MKISLQYFSGLRDLHGPQVIDISEGATVGALIEKLYAMAPNFRAWDKHLLIAADTDWVDRTHIVEAGQCISLMPPVQGG
jgi:molybdopterin converting factor small subunit